MNSINKELISIWEHPQFVNDIFFILSTLLVTAILFFISGYFLGKKSSNNKTLNEINEWKKKYSELLISSSSGKIIDKDVFDDNEELEIINFENNNSEIRNSLENDSIEENSIESKTEIHQNDKNEILKKKLNIGESPNKNLNEDKLKLIFGNQYKLNDLRLIEGIGPKIASILNDNNVYTWDELSLLNFETIKTWLLEVGGDAYKIHDPSSWPKQALIASKGNFDELKKYQEELKSEKKSKMNIIFFENNERDNLLPLTYTRPTAELRMGGLTFSERWKKLLSTNKVSYLNLENYLNDKYPLHLENNNLFINPCYFPNEELINAVKQISLDESIYYEEKLIAYYGSKDNFTNQKEIKKNILKDELIKIEFPWGLFTHNAKAIEIDFILLTKVKTSLPIPKDVKVIGDRKKIFIDKNAKVYCNSLNTTEGSIFIGENTEIMEGSNVRGGLFLCNSAKINMGSNIYGGTTIGPFSKIGGEINNTIITGYSNKGHEGFLGNSVIGEWCNLGAGTNSSNLKNNYSIVKSWNYKENRFISTNLQFSGLIMGDHSKSAINTKFNTGTICGIFSNVFCNGFPPNLISHFSWGGNNEAEIYKNEIVIEVAEKTMERRNIELSNIEIELIKVLHKKLTIQTSEIQ